MPSKFPKITVITPTLNQAAYIEKTIRSVLDQGYPDLEYLVYDAGSSDGTADILGKYSNSLKWVREPDHGQADAINKGLRASSGEVVCYLNSDDEFEAGALLKVGEFFRDNPGAVWVTGKCRMIDSQGEEVMKPVSLYKNLLLEMRNAQLLRIVNFISQPATFWRRSLLDEIGFMDETLVYVMDYDYWLRITSNHPLSFMNAWLAKFRTYPESKTRQSVAQQQDEEYRVIRRYSKSAPMVFFHYIHRLLNIAAYSRFVRTK